jgi:hypothetical protein
MAVSQSRATKFFFDLAENEASDCSLKISKWLLSQSFYHCAQNLLFWI